MGAWNTARESGCPAVPSPTSLNSLVRLKDSSQTSGFHFKRAGRFGGYSFIKKNKKQKKIPQACGERITVEDVQGGQEGPAVICVRGIGCLLRLRNLRS